jgi:hypothetical protein
MLVHLNSPIRVGGWANYKPRASVSVPVFRPRSPATEVSRIERPTSPRTGGWDLAPAGSAKLAAASASFPLACRYKTRRGQCVLSACQPL